MKSHVECNYACISLRFQARKQDTKQSVKRDERKGEEGVKIENAIAFTRKKNKQKA